MNEHLGRAIAALDDKAYEVALGELLEAWRACRHTRIANAIDIVSARISRARPGGKTIADKDTAWHALAEAGDPADVGALLAVMTEVKKADPIRFRIVQLAKLPADPRFATAMTKMLDELPVAGGTAIRSLQLGFELIATLHDRRQIVALERILLLPRDMKARAYVAKHAPQLIAQLAKRAEPVLDAAALALLDEIDACLAETTTAPRDDGDALWAAVYANPDDDGPRVVLADFLQECGDPRGEFIALQLARANAKRQEQLLREHGRTWLAPIIHAIRKGTTTFERGFLAGCDLEDEAPLEAASRIEWSTVTNVSVSAVRHRDAYLAAMPYLRVIRGAYAVPRDRPLLEQLAFGWNFDGQRLDALVQLPRLRELHLPFGGKADELEVLSQLKLEALYLQFRAEPGDYLTLLALPISKLQIEQSHGDWGLEVVADTLTITWRHQWMPMSEAEVAMLIALVGRLPSRVERVRFDGKIAVPAALQHVLAQFSGSRLVGLDDPTAIAGDEHADL